MNLLISTLTVEQQVENGIRLLDRKWPGWEKDVDLDRLYQADGNLCVLGQVTRARCILEAYGFAAYNQGMVMLGLWSNAEFHLSTQLPAAEWDRHMLVLNHGFGASNAVQDIWKARIRARRALQQAEAALSKRELVHTVMAIVVFVCLAMLGWVGEVGAQVVQNARAIAFDCPITLFTDIAHGSVPTGLFVDFYACDSSGGNCAPSPGFTLPGPSTPLLVSDPKFVHLSDGVTCEVNLASLPYPLGQVFVTKGRFIDATSLTSAPSVTSFPFITPQPPPLAPVNWRTVP